MKLLFQSIGILYEPVILYKASTNREYIITAISCRSLLVPLLPKKRNASNLW